MSISYNQDQTNLDPFRVQKLDKSGNVAAGPQAAGKLRNYTLAFGLVAGLVFSLSTWLYEDVLLSHAHVAYAWIPLLLGTIACVFVTTLAANLTWLINKTLFGLFIWLAGSRAHHRAHHCPAPAHRAGAHGLFRALPRPPACPSSLTIPRS